DFLRGRYDRAENWLTDALEYASGSPSMQGKVMTYLGSVESDRASYRRAVGHLEQAVTLSHAGREPRRQAYALSMLGRISLFRDALDAAAGHLDASIKLAEDDHWLAFLGWPNCWSRPSPGPASSAIRAGRRWPPAASPWWPRPRARPSVPSRCWPRPGPAAAGWPNPISGSTGTSSTRSATSAGGTTIPRPRPGSRRCAPWRRGRG